jgi:predicted dehydrogenase
MTAPIKIALAGISGFGDAYLDALLPNLSAWGVDFVGAVDTVPQRCRRLSELRDLGVQIHPSVQSLFAAVPVDLFMIATPIHQHAPQTCFALQHDANVFCEKPLAGTLDDAVRMLQCERASRGFVGIGYQWSYSQAVQTLKQDVMSGALGRPERLRALAFFPRSLAYFRRNDWAGRVTTDAGVGVLDSPVNNATAHYLHNMLYVLGAARETSASPASVQAELYRANSIENYDTAAVRCVTEDGVEVLFYTTLASRDRRGPALRYEFERATVEFDANAGSQLTARFRDGRTKSYGNPNHDRSEKIRQAVDSVRTGQPLACGIAGALPHTLCVVGAQESVPNVTEFPDTLRTLLALDGDVIVTVPGLADALTDCYARACLPAEHGQLAWSRAGRVVTVNAEPDSVRRLHVPKAPAAV